MLVVGERFVVVAVKNLASAALTCPLVALAIVSNNLWNINQLINQSINYSINQLKNQSIFQPRSHIALKLLR